MYDQVGGGFARYSVDARWLVPHFEKMLYDNALLARAYLHGWQVIAASRCFAARLHARRSTGCCARCARTEGGFASALDADSEGVEGKFYVWTPDEVREVLGDDGCRVAIEHFGHDARAATSRARTIPVRATPDPRPRLREIKRAADAPRASSACGPALDDKRLTAGTR